jgi:hypothetical protein
VTGCEEESSKNNTVEKNSSISIQGTFGTTTGAFSSSSGCTVELFEFFENNYRYLYLVDYNMFCSPVFIEDAKGIIVFDNIGKFKIMDTIEMDSGLTAYKIVFYDYLEEGSTRNDIIYLSEDGSSIVFGEQKTHEDIAVTKLNFDKDFLKLNENLSISK